MPPWGQVLDEINEASRHVESPFDAVRRVYLNDLYQLTGRNTILYSTAWTQAGGGPGISLNDRDVHGFMEVLHGLKGDELDLILHSPGGSAESTEQIVNYIRSKFDGFRIFVPQAAMSAATLMCCAADEVYMGRHSSLGPIDPQFMVPSTYGVKTTAAQAIIDQFSMAQGQIKSNTDLLAWQPLLQQYSPGLLAECTEAMELSRDLAGRWGENHMHADKDDDTAEQLAENMADFLSNRRYFKSHNRRIDIQQISNKGFDVVPLEKDQDLQDAILSVFHAAMHTHAGKPVTKIIENHQARAVIRKTEGAVSSGETRAPPSENNGRAEDENSQDNGGDGEGGRSPEDEENNE